MFEQLQPDGWLSKLSLRGAILNAIGFGFVAGLGLGFLIERFSWVRRIDWVLLVYSVVSLAGAVRFYFIAMSRARTKLPLA